MSKWAQTNHQIAWRQGYAAWHSGQSIGSNPYPRIRCESEAEAWDDGWFDARDDYHTENEDDE